MARKPIFKPIEWERRGECMVCTSHKPSLKGYIPMKRCGRRTRLHRLVLERKHGRQDHLQVHHSCDNPSCIRPDHLSFGTPKKNTQDAIARNRLVCGMRVKSSKLTEDQVRGIRAATGTQREIAARFCVSQKAISRILRGEAWKSLR